MKGSDRDVAVAQAIKKSLNKGRRVEIDGKNIDKHDWDYDKSNPEKKTGSKPFGSTTIKKLKVLKSLRHGKLVYEMKKFSEKVKEGKKDPKKEPAEDNKKKVDTRGKNDVQPDDDKKDNKNKQQKPEPGKQQQDDKKQPGYSLEDDSKKGDGDKQVADDGDKKAADKGKDKGGEKPDVDVKDIDGDSSKKKAGKAPGGKTKVDLDPELDPVPSDELVDEATHRVHISYDDPTGKGRAKILVKTHARNPAQARDRAVRQIKSWPHPISGYKNHKVERVETLKESRAERVVQVAREYRGKSKFESIE